MGWSEKFQKLHGRQPTDGERAAHKLQKRAEAPYTGTLELQLATECIVGGKLSLEEVTEDPMAQQQMIVSIEHGRPKTSLQQIREKITKRYGGAPASQPSANSSRHMQHAACCPAQARTTESTWARRASCAS